MSDMVNRYRETVNGYEKVEMDKQGGERISGSDKWMTETANGC